ncbi:ABC transporter related (plasmid) [Rhizobium leguminosarum bv. trifolii WSM2304]|uniref:ABC transporter related n=1 Tax=Rhizobium leguminosarum bv. trifolii (strain WSM2304) TaxID=395492 RepID=A0ABF7QZC8_RHILW|nr:ABC transporter ATP-binding protein [Rhizobium leguminosarum]ACI59694.1 ABC transporter related [Rhizobium leguminosarum bv. trifolii WSM2304]
MATETRGSDARRKGGNLLEMRDLKINGFSNDVWHEIVKGVDLVVKRGEIVGLIGESGAGKSSLGLAAMGYAKPGCKIVGGQVLFDGEDLASCSDRRLRELRGNRIAYVAQSAAAAFNPAKRLIDQTIEAAVRKGIRSRREAEADAIELYRELQLPDPEHIGYRYPHQVSGGQLQRIMTAMSMICKPDLIIFDEPTTALDVTTQVEVLASIRSLVERHHTAALYITHDLAVVAQMADRIKVLRYGETVEEAATEQMIGEPKEEYTKSLWAVRNLYKEPLTSDNVLLRVSGLSAAYGIHKVLDDVSLELPKGRTICVVGESGSGKSTLARSIAGLLPPVTGSVIYNGKALPGDLSSRDRSILKKIQLVHQIPDTALNPRHTVGETISRAVRLFKNLKGEALIAETVRLLELIELNETFYDRLPSELSGGQKQRICIARALAAEPELIICDEVTSALDQVVQEGILKLLSDLQRRLGVTYMFITHDINTVRAIADDVVVMKSGKIVDQGLKTKVLSPPYDPYTELLLSSVPKMEIGWLSGILKGRSTSKVAAIS